ncbi:MAG: hypothetical protein M5U01_27415 [Ardenticatenaceae bacterium]|nr:hypothetical protein [Ardenticatenaceae bacterium]HBY99210.1 hypothetical protein [Chloroflexota bacterium]
MLDSLNHAQVVCFTTNYSFRGVVWTGKRRLSDALNDRLTEYAELADVQVYKTHDPSTLVHKAKELYIRKASLILLAILSEVIQTPTNRIYGYVPKQRHAAVLFLPAYEVRGTLHLTAKYQVHGPLAGEGESFIPLTRASVVATFNPRVRVEAQTILVHQNLIEAFYISEEAMAQ